MSVKLLTEHHLEFLSLKGGCTSLSESTLVKMPHCWKSHVAAQLLLKRGKKRMSWQTCNFIDGKPPDKCAYLKIIFLISQTKHKVLVFVCLFV